MVLPVAAANPAIQGDTRERLAEQARDLDASKRMEDATVIRRAAVEAAIRRGGEFAASSALATGFSQLI
jgi:hypothetical protein